ncbi:hypothetical protein DRN46_00325 [Thermococci archaeon]|nr:MAG: hypothetical protein DRN46_00325 [Thermococci archaeon]RLF95406.1 MAG: hypothetical protein DRN52_03945 [Thermococci archaeon]
MDVRELEDRIKKIEEAIISLNESVRINIEAISLLAEVLERQMRQMKRNKGTVAEGEAETLYV